MKYKTISPEARQKLKAAGLHVSWNDKQQAYIVKKWPEHNGGKQPINARNRDAFKRMVRMQKLAFDLDQITAREMSVGTPMAYRDFLAKSVTGKLIRKFVTPTQTYWSQRIMAAEIQALLDSLTATPGSILVRTNDQWVGLDPGAAYTVLGISPINGIPAWIDFAAIGATFTMIPVGSTASPSLRFTGVSDRGWYNEAGNHWAYAESGKSRFQFGTGGDVYTYLDTNREYGFYNADNGILIAAFQRSGTAARFYVRDGAATKSQISAVANEKSFIANGGLFGIGTGSPRVQCDVAGPLAVKAYTVTALPSAATASGQITYVTDDVLGTIIAYSDGANWRRSSDGAVLNSSAAYLAVAGGTMAGALTLSGDPVSSLQAATKQYVDATAGGGGGGWSATIYPMGSNTSSSAYATKGFKIRPTASFQISRIWLPVTATVAGATYAAYVMTLDGSNAITAINTSATFTEGGSARTKPTIEFQFASAINLTAGNDFAIMVGRTDGADTYVMPTYATTGSVATDMPIPVEYPAPQAVLAKAVPSVGDTVTLVNSTLTTMQACTLIGPL